MRTVSVRYLTLIEPFASLVALPDSDPRKKRVENRTWAPGPDFRPTAYRPLPLLIHAGVGRRYGDRSVAQWADHFGLPVEQLRPGFAIAIARVVAILRVEEVRGLAHNSPLAWAKGHLHTSGPWCWLIGDVAPIRPFEMSGMPGLQRVDVEVDRLPANAQRWVGLRPGPTAGPQMLRTDLTPPAMGGLFVESSAGSLVAAYHG